jgi:hypothetical protein
MLLMVLVCCGEFALAGGAPPSAAQGQPALPPIGDAALRSVRPAAPMRTFSASLI